jgi:hypothetical protein
VRPNDRQRAFRKLVTLLKPCGFIALTFRSPDPDPSRGMFPASTEEIERLARTHGAVVERSLTEDDRLGRSGVQWSRFIIRLPDDGTGALPLLRHIILHDAKSSTYKLALLRSLVRIADSALGTAREVDDETVAVPLGLVALYWIRQFKPLVNADLPQMPNNRGPAGLSFAKEGFQNLQVSPLDLRVAARFARQNALNLTRRSASRVKRSPRCQSITRSFQAVARCLESRRREQAEDCQKSSWRLTISPASDFSASQNISGWRLSGIRPGSYLL